MQEDRPGALHSWLPDPEERGCNLRKAGSSNLRASQEVRILSEEQGETIRVFETGE